MKKTSSIKFNLDSIAHLWEHFIKFDADKNGLLAATELHEMITKLNPKILPQDTANMIKRLGMGPGKLLNFGDYILSFNFISEIFCILNERTC